MQKEFEDKELVYITESKSMKKDIENFQIEINKFDNDI